jgi:membrane protease YdiL (CAAX protease family)
MQNDPQHSPSAVTGLPLAARLVLFGVAIFFLDVACVVAANLLLQAVHFNQWFYGEEAVKQAASPGAEVMATRLALWPTAISFPFWVAGVAVLLRGLSVVAPADVGLTLASFRRAALWGLGAAVVVTPLVLALNLGVACLLKAALNFDAREHPLAAAGQQGLLPVEWALLAFTVMVLAPVREELLFRGILQRLFGQSRWGPHVGMGLAFLFALFSSINALSHRPELITVDPDLSPVTAALAEKSAPPIEVNSIVADCMPVLFILAMVPLYLFVWLRSARRKASAPPVAYPEIESSDFSQQKHSSAPAVFATALLFGAVHSFAWPTPVALFVLGLALGYLTIRSGSLVASVILHSLFNGVSFLLLFFGWGS